MNPALSVIIPTKNEAENLPRTLAALEDNSIPFEVIVVDASSDDNTADLAEKLYALTIRNAPGSRAAQMNLGASKASAPFLLFLHADTVIPPNGLDQIVHSLQSSPHVVGGAFTRRFDSPSLFLHLTATLASLRSKHLGFFLGDQGIFARRAIFEQLNGFNESLALCEDLDFSRRLRKKGKTIALTPPVLTSARRFHARGPLRTTLSDMILACRSLLHHPPG